MNRKPNADMDRALQLVAQGLITPGEGADLSSVSKQRFHYWLDRLGIDHARARESAVEKMWHKNTRMAINTAN